MRQDALEMSTTPATTAAEGSAPASVSVAAPAAAPATPAVAAPAAVTPAPAPSKPDVKTVMASLSPKDRFLAATGKLDQIKAPAASTPAQPSTPEAQPAAAPAAAAPAATVTEPVAAPASPESTPAATTPEAAQPNPEGANPEVQPEAGEGKDGGRIRFHGEDYAIAVLAKSKGISLAQAAELYKGTSSPAVAPAAPATPAVPAVDPQLAEYETSLTAGQTKLTELTAALKTASADMDSDKVAGLTVEIGQLQADLSLLSHEKKGYLRNRDQAVQGDYTGKVNAARDRVFAEFPVFANENGMERLALDAAVTKALNDPARKSEFQDPSWPDRFARDFAKQYGIKPKTEGAAPAVPVVPAAPARPVAITKPAPVQVSAVPTGAKLLTGADGRTPSAPRPMTRESILETVRSDPSARKAIIASLKPSTGARR
jgi:hypothetical protein